MTLFLTPRRAVACALLTFTLCGQALAQSGEPDRSLNARLLVAARNADAAGVERALAQGRRSTPATGWARRRCSSP